ncbi:MAG: protein kinase domain-containing protein [Myxococcota bacterium]
MKELDPRIRIRAPLRCDGIGRLDCAEDTVSGGRLAVRWLPLDANGDAAVKACEKLPRHPTLPRILQTGQVGASAFVALDFPEGELLSAWGEEHLDSDLLLQLGAQLSDALATVHAQGVVHGEMSRDSVLLVPGGKASLWDMPLVIANRLSDRRGENRLMQNLVKTAPYLAPERARGEGASQASDVYALGAILCVSGGAPLPQASTTLGVVNLIASGEWTPRVPSTLPEPWRAMIERMVAREPSERPTAREVATAFSTVPGQSSLPTVPEMPAVRLPPEIIAAADALMREQVEAMRAPTREVPLVQLEELQRSLVTEPVASEPPPTPAIDAAPAPAPAPVEQPAALPLAVDPVPELKLVAAPAVNPHTLDEVTEAGSPEMVRIPTMELRAIEAEVSLAPPPLPQAPTPAPAAVALTDTISVAPELAVGATTISPEELDADYASSTRVWMLFGGVMGAVAALITVVVMLATHAPEQVVVQPPAPAVQPAVAPAQPRVVSEDDELVPLPKLPTKQQLKAATRPAPVATPAQPEATEPSQPAVAPPTPSASEPAEAAAATRPADDFSFLDGAPAPKDELKRPSSEL